MLSFLLHLQALPALQSTVYGLRDLFNLEHQLACAELTYFSSALLHLQAEQWQHMCMPTCMTLMTAIISCFFCVVGQHSICTC
jgi:hypothetical protein